MNVRIALLLGPLLLSSGCFYTVQKVKETQKLRLTSEPPQATLKVEDAAGPRELGPAPQETELTYEVGMRRFFWPSFLYPVATGALGLWGGLTVVPIFGQGDPTPVLPQLIAFSLGTALTPALLIRCFVELGKSNVPWGDESLLDLNIWTNQPTPKSQEDFVRSAYTPVFVSGTAPGYGPRRLELPRPPTATEFRLVLLPDHPLVRPPPPPPPTEGAPSQCGRDLDCKGDRICVDGACVDPAP